MMVTRTEHQTLLLHGIRKADLMTVLGSSHQLFVICSRQFLI